MDSQGTALCEHFATQRALIPPLASVRAVVRFHVFLVRKSLVTVVTGIGFLPSVDTRVALQGRSGGETFVAHGARVWPLPCVGSHVDFKLGGLETGFTAHGAVEPLLSLVDLLVEHHLLELAKNFLTVAACVPLLRVLDPPPPPHPNISDT